MLNQKDMTALEEYVTITFPLRLELIGQAQWRPFETRQAVVELLQRANFLHTEIVGWLGLAKRLYTDAFADSLAVNESAANTRLQDKGRVIRPSAASLEAQARQALAPLEDAVERLEGAIKLCDKLASSCQSILRVLTNDDFGAVGGDDWPRFTLAPDPPLHRLEDV